MSKFGQKYREAALTVANNARQLLGFDPVDHVYQGRPNDGWACPITNTVYNDTPELREKYMVFTGSTAVYVFEKPNVEYEWRKPFWVSFGEDAILPHLKTNDSDGERYRIAFENGKLLIEQNPDKWLDPVVVIDLYQTNADHFVSAFDDRHSRIEYGLRDLVVSE